MVDESVVISVRNYLQILNTQGLGVVFGVIFGSQVTRKSDQWSDIDLIVISPRFDDMRTRDDLNLLWRVAARVDSRIEPIPCGERQWEEDDSSAIIEIARREGEKIDPSDKQH
jgi:predicted nucleotidyltransferase